jgi:hypothetical protein
MSRNSDPPVIIADGSLELKSNRDWNDWVQTGGASEREYPDPATQVDTVLLESPALPGGSCIFPTNGKAVHVTVTHPDATVKAFTNSGNAKIRVKLSKVRFTAPVKRPNSKTLVLVTKNRITEVLIKIGSHKMTFDDLSAPTSVTLSDLALTLRRIPASKKTPKE